MKHKEVQYSLEALYKAYLDCRKRKRATRQAIEFEFELEKNLLTLHKEILERTYEVGKSICFVVTDPKPREVWAGSFRDRIVHHLIYNAIKDRFENNFIKDTYSCIPKRGTLKGSQKALEYSKLVTNNYKERAYYLKADISNFFNSIDKDILFAEILKFVDEAWLVDLIEKVLYHDPRNNVLMKSPKWLYSVLPKHKSLFNAQIEKGLPIGNLTSQFFSNVYLNPLDQFVKNELKAKYYCRYVDDIVLLDKDPKYLNWAYSEINNFLVNNLALKLNHRKKNLNLVINGFDFVGRVIKPDRMYLRIKTVKKSFQTLNGWKNNPNKFSAKEIENFRNKMNSYLGMYKHVKGYKKRKELCLGSTTLFTYSDKKYSKIIVRDYNKEY